MVPIFSRLGFSRGWRGWWCHPNSSILMEEKGMGTFCHRQSMRWSVSWSGGGSQPPPSPFCCSFLWRNGSPLGGSWSTNMCVPPSPQHHCICLKLREKEHHKIYDNFVYIYTIRADQNISQGSQHLISLFNLKCYAPSLIRSDTTEIMRSNAVSVYHFMKEQDNNEWMIMIALNMMTITEWDSWQIPYGQAGSCQRLHSRERPK